MLQPMQRVEGRLAMTAQVRRRARPGEDKRVRHVALRGIERVRRGVQADGRYAAALQLGEERLDPVGMFVVDRDGMHAGSPGKGRVVRPLSPATWTVTPLAVAKTKAPRS